MTTPSSGVGHYSAYGLRIRSEITIPELPSIVPGETAEPDVAIEVADFPDEIENPVATSRVHQVSNDELLMRIPGVGRYLISRGEQVLIDPARDADPHAVRVYLLGTGLGALLHQRGFLVLHASGVEVAGGAVLFAGDSGAGKSTILGELLRRGYRMMVDDVCAITTDGRTPRVEPSYPRTRVWADTAANLGIDTAGLARTRADWDKFERQVPDQFCAESRPLTNIFLLAGEHPGRDVLIERVPAVAAFATLLDHTYRGFLLDGFGRRKHHFELASRTARHVSVARVWRPADSFDPAVVAARVLASLDA